MNYLQLVASKGDLLSISEPTTDKMISAQFCL